MSISLSATLLQALRIQSRIKLAHSLAAPERECERQVQEVEASKQFQLLRRLGILQLHPYPQARFAAGRFSGWQLKACDSGLPELLDGHGEFAQLLKQVGQERFQACFLQDNALSDLEWAQSCRISIEEAKRLREFVDRLYIQAEFSDSPAQLPLDQTYSVVAGVEIDDGQPVLAFFHREIWKGRYEIDRQKLAQLLPTLSPLQRRDVDGVISRLETIERRKATLYRVLECLIALQADYLTTGDPENRMPLTQRAVAHRLGISPSVLNTLISNKAVQLPWGLEAPLKVLMPSAKSLLLGRLFDLAVGRPHFTDRDLARELQRSYGANLSRRSVAYYRSNLKIGAGGCRVAA